MILPFLAITRNAFIEALRQPVAFMLVLAAGLLQILNLFISAYSLGYDFDNPAEVSGDTKLMFDIGLATVFVAGMLLAAFSATAIISREIEQKTVLTVVSKPVSRPMVVLGKYLGVAAAIVLVSLIMLLSLLFCVRHGVMSTVRDLVDQPVIVFGLGGFALAVVIAAAGNFMYGWSFPQTALVAAAPIMLIGYIITLNFDKQWGVQPALLDLKPEVLKACFALVVAVLVMAAIATAASTRLGQVMTIVVVAGVFGLGLLTNHFFGRYAFQNEPIGQIQATETTEGIDVWEYGGDPVRELAEERASLWADYFGVQISDVLPDGVEPRQWVSLDQALSMIDTEESAADDIMFRGRGAEYRIILDAPPTADVDVGQSLYYGPAPNGLGMPFDAFEPVRFDQIDPFALTESGVPGAIIVTDIDDATFDLLQTGPAGVGVRRPPLPGDFVFTTPTRFNALAFAAWSVVPNMHFFYLVDAVTQGTRIPLSHLVYIVGYGIVQITGALAVAVMLFQGREVG